MGLGYLVFKLSLCNGFRIFYIPIMKSPYMLAPSQEEIRIYKEYIFFVLEMDTAIHTK